jgi:hypothetical protein
MISTANKITLDLSTWHTIQILLEPLSRDWPEVVTETLMAIEEGVDARGAGEILAQGFSRHIESRAGLVVEPSHHPQESL